MDNRLPGVWRVLDIQGLAILPLYAESDRSSHEAMWRLDAVLRGTMHAAFIVVRLLELVSSQ